MKIMYVVSLFSGLEECLKSKKWKPSGVPTIYKLIDALERRSDELRLVLTCRFDQDGFSNGRSLTDFNLKGLRSKITLINARNGIPSWLRILKKYLKEIHQAWLIWVLFHRAKPDLIYFDRANLWTAGLFARWLKVPVVFRVMGIKHDMVEAIKGKKLMHYAMRWAYRAPYAAVICTQDGSGVEAWAKKALNSKAFRAILVNGVDLGYVSEAIDSRLTLLPTDRTIVLFVGKLERIKGCDEFLEGFLLALEKERRGLHAVIIGTGGRNEYLKEMVGKYNAQDAVSFIGRLDHEQVMNAQFMSDIYVSLNRLGNLSSANLEAMKVGQCMILPEPQMRLGPDVAAEKMLLPKNTVMRISDSDDTGALADAILHLHRNPDERSWRGEATKGAAEKFIPSWDHRVKREIDILERVIHHES